MALKVKDLLHLQSLQGLRLLSGERGLDRVVCSVGIMDYEFAEGVDYQNEAPFERDSFVISSLLFAQSDSSRILEAVKALYEMGTSACAFKSVIFDTLPQEVLDFSREKNYPIFVFGLERYFENIVYEIMEAVQRDDTQILDEQMIKRMIEGDMPGDEVSRICKNLSLFFKEHAQAVYVRPRAKGEKLKTTRIFRNFYMNKALKKKSLLCRYDGGVFVILTAASENLEGFEVILKEVCDNLSFEGAVYFSRSDIHPPHEALDLCLRESFHTFAASIAEGREYANYEKIGAISYLVPLANTQAMRTFSEGFLKPLLGREEYLSTCQEWVFQKGDINATALSMNCHQNTIRYRLSKVKELLAAEEKTEAEFYGELSAALRIHLLHESGVL